MPASKLYRQEKEGISTLGAGLYLLRIPIPYLLHCDKILRRKEEPAPKDQAAVSTVPKFQHIGSILFLQAQKLQSKGNNIYVHFLPASNSVQHRRNQF